jgi:predicted RNA-binding Zn-ribbon protein involved in translation (DUF1610 family)
MKRIKRRPLFVSWQRLPAFPCPQCGVLLRSATGLNPNETIYPTPGALSLCDQCHRWNVFTDGLGLRPATADEIARIPDELRAVAEAAAIETGRRVPGIVQ